MKLSAYDNIVIDAVDKWLAYRFKSAPLVGGQLCIRKSGTALLNTAYGSARNQNKTVMTTEHLCRMASNSKMFTCCALLMLEREGKLHFGDKVTKYIPQLASHRDKRFAEITIGDLVSHRAGIYRDGFQPLFWGLEQPFPSREILAEAVLQSDLICAPQGDSKYSNLGFSLLGEVIEAASGSSYEKWVRENVIEKIGLSHTHPDYTTDLDGQMADGHSRPIYDGERKPFIHVATNAMAVATGFCSTAGDASLFLHEFLAGDRLLRTDTQQMLLSTSWPVKNSQNERYGYALRHDQAGDLYLIGHSGSFPGFTAETRLWNGTDYIFSFILNTYEPAAFGAIAGIAEMYKLVETTFCALDKVSVSLPLSNCWGSAIWIVGNDRALMLDVDTWSPCNRAMLFEKRGQEYISDQASGYRCVGEPAVFGRDANGDIISVTCGMLSASSEADFLERSRKTVSSRDNRLTPG